MDAFTSATSLGKRLDAYVAFFAWVRASDAYIVAPLPREPMATPWSAAEWKRDRVWLSILEQSPEVRLRYRASIAAILESTDGVGLFAESGLPSDRGLLPETFDRLFGILLPEPREETDLARLLLRLFPTEKEVDRFFNLPAELGERVANLAAPGEDDPVWRGAVEWLLDAFCLLGARVQGLGLSKKLRMRGLRCSVQESAFYRLTRAGDGLVDAVRNQQDVTESALAWKSTVAECRAELNAIIAHLDARGVNLGHRLRARRD